MQKSRTAHEEKPKEKQKLPKEKEKEKPKEKGAETWEARTFGSQDVEDAAYVELEESKEDDELTMDLSRLETEIRDSNTREFEDFRIKSGITQDMCQFCGNPFENPAMTIMACGVHKFHNWCAHVALFGAGISKCIYCDPRKPFRHVFSTRDEKKAARQLEANPYDMGDDVYQAENAQDRSILFQTLGEYKVDFSISTIHSSLAYSNNDIKHHPVLLGIWNIVKKSLDIDIVQNAPPVERVRSLLKNMRPVAELAAAKVTGDCLVSLHISIDELFENKYTIEHLACLGVTLDHLMLMGFDSKAWGVWRRAVSVTQLVYYYNVTAFFVLNTLCRMRMSAFGEIGLSVTEMAQLYATVPHLIKLGLTWSSLTRFNALSLADWAKLGLSRTHLVEMKVTSTMILGRFKTMTELDFCQLFSVSSFKAFDEEPIANF
jgi:hypothetical protein